jgi:hypothetical protein
VNCQETQIILEEIIEEGGALPEHVTAHLASYERCTGYFEEMTRLWGALDLLPAVKPTPGFQVRFWQRVRQLEAPSGWGGRWAEWWARALRPPLLAAMTLLLVVALGTALLVQQSPTFPLGSGTQVAGVEDDQLLESLASITETGGPSPLANFDLWEGEGEELPGFPTPLLAPQGSPETEKTDRGASHEKIG